MPRRIDVELTSHRDDGSWTWRAAGAKQPKGVVDSALLYEGAKVGDVVRAEADFEIDGITITNVVPPPSAKAKVERLEIIGTRLSDDQLVTSSLVGRSDRPRRSDDRRGGDRTGRGGPPRGDRPGRDGDRRPSRDGDRTGRPGAERGADRGARRPDGRPGREQGRDQREQSRDGARAGAGRPAERGRPRRLTPGTAHRDAVLADLAPEQRVIAEQVLKGGLPAVRRAIDEQNTQARAAGQTEVKADALVALAEEALPRLKVADWKDRATAAVKDLEEIGLRDLRSVVASADAARDEESRELARQLKEALDRRSEKQRTDWVADIESNMAGGRLTRAMRVASRPPDPNLRLTAELATRLAEAASAGLAPDVSEDRWLALLEAVVASPVRRNVKPAGLPADASPALRQAATQAAGHVPALAGLLGIPIPPPPGPRPGAPASRPSSTRPPRTRNRSAEPRPARPASGDQAGSASTPPATSDASPAPAGEPAGSATAGDDESPAPSGQATTASTAVTESTAASTPDSPAQPEATSTPEPAPESSNPAPTDPPAAASTGADQPDPDKAGSEETAADDASGSTGAGQPDADTAGAGQTAAVDADAAPKGAGDSAADSYDAGSTDAGEAGPEQSGSDPVASGSSTSDTTDLLADEPARAEAPAAAPDQADQSDSGQLALDLGAPKPADDAG